MIRPVVYVAANQASTLDHAALAAAAGRCVRDAALWWERATGRLLVVAEPVVLHDPLRPFIPEAPGANRNVQLYYELEGILWRLAEIEMRMSKAVVFVVGLAGGGLGSPFGPWFQHTEGGLAMLGEKPLLAASRYYDELHSPARARALRRAYLGRVFTVAHEIGHALALPHSDPDPYRYARESVMSYGRATFVDDTYMLVEQRSGRGLMDREYRHVKASPGTTFYYARRTKTVALGRRLPTDCWPPAP